MNKHDNRETGAKPKQDTYETENSSRPLPAIRQEQPSEPPKDKSGKRKKLTRKEKKELAKQQAQFEKQLVKEGKIAPRYRYVPHSGFARILSVCLAFVIGFFGAFGALVGGFAYFGTQKNLKEISEIAGIDYTEFFTETAAELSALDLIVEIAEKYGNGELNTLQSFAAYSPLVDSLAEATCEQFANAGFQIEKSELMAVPFSELGGWINENVIQKVTLADFFGIDENTDDLFLRAICFKEENGETHAVTVNEFADDSKAIIGDVEIEILLDTDGYSDAALKYLAYGSEYDLMGERRYVVDETDGSVTMVAPHEKKTLNSLTDEDADLIGGAKLGDLVNIDEHSSRFLQAVRNWSVNDLTNQFKIERLKIGQILNCSDGSNLLQAVFEWRVGDLSDQAKINTLTLSDVLVIDESSAKILVSLKDARLGEFSDAIDTLRISEILSEEDIEQNKILRNLKNSSLLSLSDDINDISIKTVFADEMYSYLSMSAAVEKYNAVSDKTGAVPVMTGSYEEIVAAYETNKKLSYELAGIIPESIELKDGEEIVTETCYGGSRVQLGFFRENVLLTDVLTGVRKTAEEGRNTEVYYYTQTETEVVPVYEWNKFDYDSGEAVPLGSDISGYDILEDDFGYYFNTVENGELVRVDLERTLTGYEGYGEPNELGDIVIGGEAYRVYEKDGGYYILLREENVTQHYYDPENLEIVESGGVTTRYYLYRDGVMAEELDRYIGGVWYLLFGGEGDYSVDVPILAIDKTITQAVAGINNMKLWELYLHGLITVNPFKKFDTPYQSYTNLNELSITEMIYYIQSH